MKKKILVTLSTLALVATCTACGNKTENTTSDTSITPNETTEVNEKGDSSSTENTSGNDVVIKINGVVNEFPMTYQELIDHGWEVCNIEDPDPSKWLNGNAGLQPGDSNGLYCNNGELMGIPVFFYNPTDEFCTLDKCIVYGFQIDYDHSDNEMYFNKRDYMSVPDGSIKLNEYSIGESDEDEMLEDAIFDNIFTDVTFDGYQCTRTILIGEGEENYDRIWRELTYIYLFK